MRGSIMASTAPEPATSRRSRISSVWFLLLISAIMNSIGADWGLPNDAPWHPDSIAGIESVLHRNKTFGEWEHRYPRVQFIINAVFYEPFLRYWATRPVRVRTSAGPRMRVLFLSMPRISLLIRISRVVSALMGVGVVVAVLLTARLLFRDELAAILAAGALAVCQGFIFLSHLGNVDLPATFWFAWGLYFALKAVQSHRWRHFLLLGVMIGLAACTKEPLAAYAVGLAAGTAVLLVSKRRAEGRNLKQAVRSLLNQKVIAAAVVSLLIFCLLNGLLTNPDAFARRMRHWIGHAGATEWNVEYAGQLNLLGQACADVYGSMGWPLLAATILGAVYCLKKFPKEAVYCILPLVSFYVLVVVNVRYTHSRFYLPALAGLMILAGKGLADFIRGAGHRRIRRVIVSLVFVLSFGYGLATILEMIYDTRHRAEDWFVENVPKETHVAALASKHVAPQIALDGFYYTRRWAERQTADILRGRPPYVIMVENAYTHRSFDPKLKEALLNGSLGYKQAAVFERTFLYPAKNALSIAGWPIKTDPVLSPRVIVLTETSHHEEPQARQ